MIEESEYANDLAEEEALSIDTDASMGEMCLQVLLLMKEGAEREAALKQTQAKLKTYTERLIPEKMESTGTKKIETPSGLKIEIEKIVRAAIPKDPVKKAQAFEYLKETGNEGLIRTVFEVSYGINSTEGVDDFRTIITDHELMNEAEVTEEQKVHPSQLLAFVKEELRQGHPIPEEPFSIYVQNVAKISMK